MYVARCLYLYVHVHVCVFESHVLYTLHFVRCSWLVELKGHTFVATHTHTQTRSLSVDLQHRSVVDVLRVEDYIVSLLLLLLLVVGDGSKVSDEGEDRRRDGIGATVINDVVVEVKEVTV